MDWMQAEPGDGVFECEQTIQRPRGEVFEFFSDVANLERITPPWIGFHITERTPGAMRAGSRFTYKLKLHGLPMRWRTLIAEWEPDVRFIDIQERGPYAKWHHLHVFEDGPPAVPAGPPTTIIRDRVVYRLPFGTLGRLVAGRWVRSDVERIFSYRREATERWLETSNHERRSA